MKTFFVFLLFAAFGPAVPVRAGSPLAVFHGWHRRGGPSERRTIPVVPVDDLHPGYRVAMVRTQRR